MVKRNSRYHYFFDSLLLFLFFQPFVIFSISTAYLAVAFIVGLLFTTYKFQLPKTLMFFLVLMIAHFFILTFFSQSVNYSVNLIIKFGCSIFLGCYIFRKYVNIYEILYVIALATAFHYVIIIMQIAVPGFKEQWFSVVANSGVEKLPDNVYNELPLRSNGVNGFLFAEDGAIFAIAASFFFVYYNRKECKGKLKAKLLQYSSLILSLICGRTAIIPLLINFHVMFISFSYLKKIFFLMSLFIFVNIFIYVLSVFFPVTYNWLFEPINNLIEGRALSGSTNETIAHHLYWLDNLQSDIFGYGIFSFDQADYDVYNIHQSDSGYVRLLVSGGMVQIFIFLLPSVYLFFKTMPIAMKYNKVIGFLYFDLFLFSLAFTFKSFFVFSSFYWVYMIAFFCWAKNQKKIKMQKISQEKNFEYN